MKRLLSFLLLFFLSVPALAETDDLSWISDEQHEQRRYTCSEESVVSLDLMSLTARGEIDLKEIDLLEGYTGEGADIFSLSPDGQRVIIRENNLCWSVWNRQTKTLTQMVASKDKGSPDIYGKLKAILNDMTYMTKEEFVWSPDGRYAVPVNARDTLQRYIAQLDPILIDTYTGEVIITATWDTPLMGMLEGASPLHACFSSDGNYLYYTLIGSMGLKYRYRLMRYHIPSGKTDTVFMEDSFPAWCCQDMFETKDGSFATIYSPSDRSEACGITLYLKEDDRWSRNTLYFDLTSQYFYAAELEYNGASGFGVAKNVPIAGRSETVGSVSAFKTFRLSGGELEDSGCWMLQGAKEPQLVYCTAEEYAKLFGEETGHAWLLDHWSITCIRMSPDGCYALISCARQGQERLLLYDFEKQTITPVKKPENVQVRLMGSAEGTGFSPGISWCEDGTLLLLTDSGAQAYRMK